LIWPALCLLQVLAATAAGAADRSRAPRADFGPHREKTRVEVKLCRGR
jgi:hypothetical protein